MAPRRGRRFDPTTLQPTADELAGGLTWREYRTWRWSASYAGIPRADVMRESEDPDAWVASVRLGEPSAHSPVTAVGTFPTAEAAMVATDDTWNGRDTAT